MRFFNFTFSRMDDVLEVFYLISDEGTLIHLESDTGFGEGCEHFVNVMYVFLEAVRVNDNFFYIDETGFPGQISEDHVELALICPGAFVSPKVIRTY